MKKVEIFKNGKYEELHNVAQGVAILETINEVLDGATFLFDGRAENEIEVLQSVRITIGNYQKCFLVADVQCDLVGSGEIWNYVVTLIEPTKYLEKVICPFLAFTNRNDNLGCQIEKALINAEPVEKGYEPRFKLSDEAKAYLYTIDGADFYFDKMTLREVLDGFLAKINSRAVIKELTDYNNIMIDIFDLNMRKKKISLANWRKKYVHNIEYLSSDIESYVANSIGENQNAVWHPSANSWDTFKTNEATLTENNATIFVPFRVEAIKKFILKIGLLFRDIGHNIANIVYELDISRNVLPSETRALLKSVGSMPQEAEKTETFYLENTISFEKGSMAISGAAERISRGYLWLKMWNLEVVVKNVFWNDPVNIGMREAHPEYSQYEIKLIPDSDFPPCSKILYRIEYIPQIDARLKISKEGYQGPPATINSQQRDRHISIRRYGDNLYGQVNRLGNRELIVPPKFYKDMNEVYNLGDYTEDNYIVVGRRLAIYNDFLKVDYQFTKNFNALSTKIGIDRHRQIYNIPLEYSNSNFLIKEYICADFGTEKSDDILVNNFMLSFTKQPYMPLNMGLIKTIWQGGESNWFQLSVVGYAVANTVNYFMSFLDNFSAGMSIENKVIGGKKIVPNPYCNPKTGEYEEIEIRLINEYQKGILFLDDPEIAKTLPKTEIGYYSGKAIIDRNYISFKDAFEYKTITFVIEMRSLDSDIIIGPSLAERSAILNNEGNELYVYVGADKYYFGDKFIKGKKAKNQNLYVGEEIPHFRLGYITVNFSDIEVNAWAVGDAAGNLFIASNQPAKRSIMFTHRKRL